MRALTVTNRAVTREVLLRMAEKVPGAWVGLRIAAMLLVLEGWRSTDVARLFDVARWSVVKWIRRANEEGVSALEDRKRSGRPCRLSVEIRRDLEKALQNNPKQLGLQRNRWDGVVVVEYLRRVHGVRLRVRKAVWRGPATDFVEVAEGETGDVVDIPKARTHLEECRKEFFRVLTNPGLFRR